MSAEQEALHQELDALRTELAKAKAELKDQSTKVEQYQSACGSNLDDIHTAREMLELANTIVESSPGVLFRRLSGDDPKLVYVSKNIAQWGITAEQLLSGDKKFSDLVHPDDEEALSEEIEHYRKLDSDSYVQEYRLLTPAGQTHWVVDKTSVVRDADGTPLFNQGLVIDITNRKKAEQSLRASEYKFRRTIEGAGEGYLLMDEELRIREVNEAYCKMIGYSADEIIGKRPADFATDEYRQFLIQNKDRLLSQDYRQFEGAMVAKDGTHIPILVHGNTLRAENGDFLGHVAFVANITEQKKALVLAEEVQRSLLPNIAPQTPGLDVAGMSQPSESVGGDYFDYLESTGTTESGLSVVVGDVSGHGVDAALLMTTARGFLRMRAAQPGSASQIVVEMNRHLASDLFGTGRFMTLFLLQLHPDNDSIRWVRAGHDPAILYCPNNDEFTELVGPGMPLGVLEDFNFEEQQQTLRDGQVLAIGTDGIWEATSPEDEMYGKERFKKILQDNAKLCAEEILNLVFKDLHRFTGGARPSDDITLVIIKRRCEE